MMESNLKMLPLVFLISFSINLFQPANAIDEGEVCVACTVLAALVFEHPNDTDAALYNHDVNKEYSKLCSVLLSHDNLDVQQCLDVIENSVNLNPDEFCAHIGLCKNPACKLFDQTPFPPSPYPPDPPNDPSNRDFIPENTVKLMNLWRWSNQYKSSNNENVFYRLWDRIIEDLLSMKGYFNKDDEILLPTIDILPSHPCYGNEHVLQCIIQRFGDEHHPILDSDGDDFSLKENRGLRGSHWRGADCNDSDANIYPGRKENSYSVEFDHDCNGIYGIDPETGISLEEMFCMNTERRGLIHIGDSATAHFHIPPQWMTKNGWNVENLIPDVLDELDQPACAWGSAYRNDSGCPYANRKDESLGSVASRLRERNLCNHRDVQNIGVNGASSDNAWRQLIPSVKRNKTQDHPVLAIFSLIGNDVCNGHEGTSAMTTPEEFHDYVTDELKSLDEILPENSYVLLVGLVDGSLLWENLHDRQHPIGATYAEIYEALHCTETSPCVGWLTANETLRQLSTERAKQLNEQFPIILGENNFSSFKAKYLDIDWRQIVQDYKDGGGDAVDLFEPVDGFHPSHLMNQMLSDVVWGFLETDFPEAIGEINPFNDEIRNVFGDQGGF